MEDAPVGYNIGEGRFRTSPGARSGYDIVVGSDKYRSIAALFQLDGQPLALASGTLTYLADGSTSVVFTNRTGRTAISNLSPGRYRLDFYGMDISYQFTVKESSGVYENIGTIELRPE